MLSTVRFLSILVSLEQTVELRVRVRVWCHVVVGLTWFVDYVRVHIKLWLLIVAILVKHQRVQGIVVAVYRRTCRAMLVACLILHCCLLVVYILVRLDLLSNTLLRAVRFMLLLTSWFFLRLCIFLVVVDVFTHEHLASEDVIDKSHRRLTWSHRLDFILELLCCKQIGFRLVAMLSLSEVIGWI